MFIGPGPDRPGPKTGTKQGGGPKTGPVLDSKYTICRLQRQSNGYSIMDGGLEELRGSQPASQGGQSRVVEDLEVEE